MKKKGFTLIELLIVIAIIGILAVIGIPAYIGQQRNAARTEAYANLQNLAMLEAQLFADNGCYYKAGGPPPVCTDNQTVTGVVNIQAFLPGFKPGTGTNFTYAITINSGVGLPTPIPVPYAGTTANLPSATTPCFIATATGNATGRVPGEVFAIDCNNIKNF